MVRLNNSNQPIIELQAPDGWWKHQTLFWRFCPVLRQNHYYSVYTMMGQNLCLIKRNLQNIQPNTRKPFKTDNLKMMSLLSFDAFSGVFFSLAEMDSFQLFFVLFKTNSRSEVSGSLFWRGWTCFFDYELISTTIHIFFLFLPSLNGAPMFLSGFKQNGVRKKQWGDDFTYFPERPVWWRVLWTGPPGGRRAARTDASSSSGRAQRMTCRIRNKKKHLSEFKIAVYLTTQNKHDSIPI